MSIFRIEAPELYPRTNGGQNIRCSRVSARSSRYIYRGIFQKKKLLNESCQRQEIQDQAQNCHLSIKWVKDKSERKLTCFIEYVNVHIGLLFQLFVPTL